MLLKGFYELLRPLSENSHLAKNRRTGKEVVVREIALRQLKNWETLSRLEDEAKILARVRHPAVPAFVDSFALDEETPDPRFFLVREFVPGTPLSNYLGARPSLEELISLGDRLLATLAELHALSPPLFHGALTPKRILEGPEKQLIFLGFGTSSLSASDDSDYSAPERDGGPATAATDLYSVGAILYHLATGEDPGAILRVDGRPQLSPAVAPRLRGLLSRLLAADPSARPSSAEEARRLLLEGAAETALALRPETALDQRRNQAKQAGAAAALVALLGSALALSAPGVALLLLPAMVVALYLTIRPTEPASTRKRGEERAE